MSGRVRSMHAATGPTADSASATLASCPTHAPITVNATVNAALAAESTSLTSCAAYVALAAIPTAVCRREPIGCASLPPRRLPCPVMD